MKRIAIVAHGMSGGGAERVACILANYLARSHRVLFLAAYDDRREYELDGRVELVPVHTGARHAAGRWLDRSKSIFSALRSHKTETAISFLTSETLFAEMAGIPVIYSLRNDPGRVDCGFPKAQLRSLAYRRAKHIVFQTEGARRYFPRAIREKSSVIPNPLAVEKLPLWRESEHNSVFVAACRLERQKNLPLLIGAFAAFHKSNPRFSLEIYGEGSLFQQLARQIRALDASDCIHLMGRSRRIHDVMRRCLAFVSSSDYEGLSNAMLEALAIGVPCICTDCSPGGAREFIRHMENGILVPTGDETAMRGALQLLAEDSSLRERLSARAVRLREILDMERVCARWKELIE